jgi:uncharacterized protein (DUF58 family)
MKLIRQLNEFLESHWISPAYSGCLLAALALCFFAAATNTMAGWLYVLSGVIFALLIVGAVIPAKSLSKLKIRRLPIAPVSVGEALEIELEIDNPTPHPQTLLQVRDILPKPVGKLSQTAIEVIPPQSLHRWVELVPAPRRGIYRWQEVQLRTGNPLGLFWCRRSRQAPAKAVVYPQVLPLTQCPLIDRIGQEDRDKLQSERRYQTATEGVTQSLRPYRYGDSTRLIHWRTSARFEEFQVRELETITGGQEIAICLDTASRWEGEHFEQAVIAAASLYFYAAKCQLNVQLWTAETGLVHGNYPVLETLAAVASEQDSSPVSLPNLPLLWLTQNPASLDDLPADSPWLFFTASPGEISQAILTASSSGLLIHLEQPLQLQLQKPLR